MPPQLHLPEIRISSNLEVLSDNGWGLNRVGKLFGEKVPGLRPTTTFLTTLASNLQLSATGALSPSLQPSACSTPTSPHFSPALQQPKPPPLTLTPPVLKNVRFVKLSHAAASAAVMASTTSESQLQDVVPQQQDETPTTDALPELTYSLAPTEPEDDRVEALRLVADSIAQQRQTAARALILHPVSIALTVVLLAVLERYMDLSTLATTAAGIVMSGLVAVRSYTKPYIDEAEKISYSWLEQSPSNNATHERTSSNDSNGSSPSAKGVEPLILTAHWGEELIGACIFRIQKRERKAYIRAWTVKLRYRRRGVGTGLLEEAAKIAWQKGARGMEFDRRHANSLRILPGNISLLGVVDVPTGLNGGFEGREAKNRDVLGRVVSEVMTNKKGKR